MNNGFPITVCPSCRGKKVKRVRRTVRGKIAGRSYAVPMVEFYQCPDCGERIYEPHAMRRIEAARRLAAQKRQAAS